MRAKYFSTSKTSSNTSATLGIQSTFMTVTFTVTCSLHCRHDACSMQRAWHCHDAGNFKTAGGL